MTCGLSWYYPYQEFGDLCFHTWDLVTSVSPCVTFTAERKLKCNACFSSLLLCVLFALYTDAVIDALNIPQWLTLAL